MAITIACPHCKTRIQILPEHGGRQLACPKCQGAFTAPRLAAPATPPARSKPAAVAPIQAQSAATDESSCGSSTGDPLGFLNDSEREDVRPASAGHRTPRKPKSFMDTMAAAAGNLLGSQPASKNAKIGAKSKGLPPAAKKALLGGGGVLALLLLCSGLLTIANRGTTSGQKPTSQAEARQLVVGVYFHTLDDAQTRLTIKPDKTFIVESKLSDAVANKLSLPKIWRVTTNGKWAISEHKDSNTGEPLYCLDFTYGEQGPDYFGDTLIIDDSRFLHCPNANPSMATVVFLKR